MTIKKILILSVSAGAGHVRAAQAIEAEASQHSELEVIHLDAMDYVPASFRKLYTDLYLHLVNNFSTAWSYVYERSNALPRHSKRQRLRRAVERLNTHKLRAAIRHQAPDAIVCTHFLPAEMLARESLRDELGCPVWVQVTDFDLHSMWLQPGMAGYFTANEEVAWRLSQRGIPDDGIHVTGIPIMPVFSTPPLRDECASDIGLDAAKPTLLFMSGGAGVGDLTRLVSSVLDATDETQVIALAGRNEEMLQKLQALAEKHPGRLYPSGFTTQVERLMVCADIVVTKPGGLTTSECLALGRPMIVHSPIPGQEEHNADFLLEQGAALKAVDEAGLIYRLQRLLTSPAELEALRQRATTLGKPHAAARVLHQVLNGSAHPAAVADLK